MKVAELVAVANFGLAVECYQGFDKVEYKDVKDKEVLSFDFYYNRRGLAVQKKILIINVVE